MPKQTGYPPGFLPIPAVLEQLGMMSEKTFHKSGLAEFLNYYQVDQIKLYWKEEVVKVGKWLFVRRGKVALGLLPPDPPFMPPGEDSEARWKSLEMWLDEDFPFPNNIYCPQCGTVGVESDYSVGPIWCPKCGVIRIVRK